jgi:CubicO group peptidase (beta-lactamase class C family)
MAGAPGRRIGTFTGRPGTAIVYSNFGFDLLAIALSEAAKKPYPELLKETITGPLGMKDRGFALTDVSGDLRRSGIGVREPQPGPSRLLVHDIGELR